MRSILGKVLALCTVIAMLLVSVPADTVKAASKPKLLTKKITVYTKKSKTIRVKKSKGTKLYFKSANKKTASVSSKGKVTGKKKGNTTVTVFYKKGKAKKKLGVVKITVKTKEKKPSVTVDNGTPTVDNGTPTTNTPAPSTGGDSPQQTPGNSEPTLDLNNLATFSYPTLYTDVPDLDIIRNGENYYMVSTTMNMCPGVPVMKSTDLVHWQIVNYVYDTFENDDVTNLENGKNMYSHGSWAASLKYDEVTGKYYVAFNSNDHGFYIYTTTDIENGTWEKYSTSTRFHDPALFFEAGKMYVISAANGTCNMQQLQLIDSSKSVKTVGSSVKLFTAKGWGLWEGAHAYKVGDYYYVCIIASPTDKWMRTEVCYRSKELAAGTWEEKVIYQGGSGGATAGLAQGGLVQTQFGDWYGFLFQDRNGVGRIPSVVAVDWQEDWPIMGMYDSNGVFQPSKSQGTTSIRLNNSGLDNYIVSDDDFTYAEGEKLKLVWQWNHNPKNDFWSVTANPGYLRLTTDTVVPNIRLAHNSLTQRTYGPKCNSETKISVANMKPGDYAGLATVADHAGMIGVMCDENGDKYITQAKYTFPKASENDTSEVTVKAKYDQKLSDNADVYLKIEYSFGSSDKATFYYSLDGTTWTKLGTTQTLAFSTSTTFMGARTWLFNYATKEAGGYVDFDYYKIYS